MKTRRLISIIVTLSMIASCFTFMAISGEAAAGDDISLTYNINGMTSISINTTDELSADKIGAYATHEIGIANSNGRCLVPVDGVYSERYSLDPDTPATYGSNAMFCGVVAEGTTLGHASRVAYNPYVAYEISADSGFAIDTLTVDLEYILMPYNHVRSEIGIFVTDDFDSNVNSETGEFDFSGSVLADVLEGYDRADSTANVDMRASQSGPMTVDLSSAVAKLSDTSSVYVIVVLMRGADQVARVRLYSLKFDATQKVSAGGSAGKDIVINAGIANVTPTSDLTGSMSPDDINAYYVHNCVVTPRTSSQANIITPSLGHTPQIMTGSYDLNPDKTFDGGEHVHYGALKEGSTIAGVRANLTVQNPYVCYKLNGDAGYVIDGLTAEIGCYLRIGSHENSTSDAAYYQVGIWVTDNFTIDENGIFDFSAIPYSHLISSSDTQATDTRNSPSTVDLSDAVRQLNSDCVYVIFLLNRGYGQADATRLGISTLKLTATQAVKSEEPAPALPTLTVSIADEAGGDKIDNLYLNAAISASEERTVGIIFSDTEDSCAYGANPLFIRKAVEGHGRSSVGFIQSGCYGSSIITASNLGGEEGDSVLALYWQDMPTSYGTLYARVFAINEDGTYDYGDITPITLTDGTNINGITV